MPADQPAVLPLARALPALSRELRKAAKAVLSIGYDGRSTPEKILERKQQVAAHLEALAGTVDAALAKSEAGGAR